ncbi:unnamed protein product [Hymenolepis diminuta]|uniref:Uncharacterized protein n=1 Tax=Hymenolepis diminuta TaxID=6216 RepID=A0A564XXJ9_HYMDI|nr:unnamed protein product [Hymenolepis diminuta]
MLSRGLIQVIQIKLSLFSTQEKRASTSYRLLRFLFISSLFQRAPLSISPSVTRFKLVVTSLNTFLVYSTLGVLLHNCC